MKACARCFEGGIWGWQVLDSGFRCLERLVFRASLGFRVKVWLEASNIGPDGFRVEIPVLQVVILSV